VFRTICSIALLDVDGAIVDVFCICNWAWRFGATLANGEKSCLGRPIPCPRSNLLLGFLIQSLLLTMAAFRARLDWSGQERPPRISRERILSSILERGRFHAGADVWVRSADTSRVVAEKLQAPEDDSIPVGRFHALPGGGDGDFSFPTSADGWRESRAPPRTKMAAPQGPGKDARKDDGQQAQDHGGEGHPADGAGLIRGEEAAVHHRAPRVRPRRGRRPWRGPHCRRPAGSAGIARGAAHRFRAWRTTSVLRVEVPLILAPPSFGRRRGLRWPLEFVIRHQLAMFEIGGADARPAAIRTAVLACIHGAVPFKDAHAGLEQRAVALW